jgi:hypothetical protein
VQFNSVQFILLFWPLQSGGGVGNALSCWWWFEELGTVKGCVKPNIMDTSGKKCQKSEKKITYGFLGAKKKLKRRWGATKEKGQRP